MNSTYLVKYNYWSSLYKKEKWGMKEKLPFMRINLTVSAQINLCRALAVYKNSTLSKWWSIEIFAQKVDFWAKKVVVYLNFVLMVV